jgi:hypothetical protein
MGVKFEDVMERFLLMADLGSSAAARYRPLCEDAMAEIGRRVVRDDAESQPFLCAAAAALMLYRWSLLSASADLGSFAAGDVKITKSGTNAAVAKQVWEEAAAAAAPFLADNDFLFERIQK